jgi:hypothetical protein
VECGVENREKGTEDLEAAWKQVREIAGDLGNHQE